MFVVFCSFHIWFCFLHFVLTSVYFSYFLSPPILPYLCTRVRNIICISVDAGYKPLLVPCPFLCPIIVVKPSLFNPHVFVCLHICLNICRVKAFSPSLVRLFSLFFFYHWCVTTYFFHTAPIKARTQWNKCSAITFLMKMTKTPSIQTPSSLEQIISLCN